MRIVMFYHSLLSDWNNGHAHFLRGVVAELRARGHDMRVYEPRDAWSVQNLVQEHGPRALEAFRAAFPILDSIRYDATLDVNEALDGADLVIVHEWNDHGLVQRIGEHRAANGAYRLFFHDTHHRAVTQPDGMRAYDLRHYDGALVFGEVLREMYERMGWAQRAWTWHEAADTRVFHPVGRRAPEGDLVWVGNWGDEERTEELRTFMIEPVRALGLRARVYGVRYPDDALRTLADQGIEYGGWLPNYRAPEAFARFRVTMHIPRRPYVEALPGIPTIRVFEALACGIPLVSAPWHDTEGLFTADLDYLAASDGPSMRRALRTVLNDPCAGCELSTHGLHTILARHTCAHRVDELLKIVHGLNAHETQQRTVAPERQQPLVEQELVST